MQIYSGPWIRYSEFKKRLGLGEINLLSNVFKVSFLTDSYVPDIHNDEVWSDVSSHEVSDANYTANGSNLLIIGLERDDETESVVWACDVVGIGPLSTPKSIKYAVIYDSSHVENILVCYCLLNANEESITTDTFFMMLRNGILRLK